VAMPRSRTPDELALAGPEHLDPAYVAWYDRKAGIVDPEDDFEELRPYGLDSESTVIDFGAGTGTFALAAALVCKRVVAVDVSPPMIAAIRAKARDQGSVNVDVFQAGFLSYEHSGQTVDAIYTRNALHHLPDFWKAIALHRMAGLLRPGGVLRLRDIVFRSDPDNINSVFEAWLASAAARSEDGWTREEFETHLRDEYSTFSWLLELMIEQAGLKIDRAGYDQLGVYADYICVKPNG
jgi:SAM-dependent methyltransferase